MEAKNHSQRGYYKPRRNRKDKNYPKTSAEENAYRQQKIVETKKSSNVYPVSLFQSLKNDPKSLTDPISKFAYRKLFRNSKEIMRNIPPTIIKSDLDSLTKILKSLLNKLTPTNFEAIKEKICEQFNQMTSVSFSSLLLAKACIEIKYCETYSRLCRDLVQKFPYFRKNLLEACQELFEGHALESDDENLNKKKVLGCVSFVGELLNSRIIPGKVIISCCKQLLLKNTEVAIEGVCYFLSTCSGYFQTSSAKESGHELINILQTRSEEYSTRIKFQIQDIVESRKIQTIVMRNEEKPKTVYEVRNNL